MGDIEVNIDKAIKEITKSFGAVKKNTVTIAASNAINRAILSSRMAGAKEVIKVYNIKPDTLKQRAPSRKSNAIVLWKSNRNSLTGKIMAYGGPLPLVGFPTREDEKGITLEVKKGRAKHIRGAFYTLSRKGSLKIKAHGKYTKGIFQFNKMDRLITQIMTASVRSVMVAPSVTAIMKKKAEETFVKRFTHELTYRLKK